MSSGLVYSSMLWLMPPALGDEDHAGRADRGEHLRVVPGAARQPLDRQIEFFGDRFDPRHQMRREGDRIEAGERAGFERHTLGRRGLRGEGVQAPLGLA